MLDIQRIAAHAVQQVLDGASLPAVLRALRETRLTPHQRAAIQDAAYGTLRHHGELKAIVDALSRQRITDKLLCALLTVALYQLLYGRAAAHTVVDHAVDVVQQLGKAAAKGLVNAVLRNFLRKRELLLEQVRQGSEVARYSYPQWWIDRVRASYPQRWQDVLDAGNQRPPMTLRVNRRACSVEKYSCLLDAANIPAMITGDWGIKLKTPVVVEKLPYFSAGWVTVQDLGAQYAAPLLDVCPGMRVLDACCAPGGKTTHLLEFAKVELTALDQDEQRQHKTMENLARLELSARCVVGDARQPETWWDGVAYDRILLDAPCSSSGVVRRHPDIKWLRRESDIEQYAGQQTDILNALWRTLGEGGKLLYTTCSLFPDENYQRIVAFLAQHPDAQLQPLEGVKTLDGQLLPDVEHDGFYYALLQKSGDSRD
ncbi:MAG: 16S rRNA (cytosine(967)-C(5))-methyltransferase RsmB [Burkholderiales bacterium]